jgi:hypothetical protein
VCGAAVVAECVALLYSDVGGVAVVAECVCGAAV